MYARRGNFLLAKHEVLRWDVVDSAQIGSASMRGDGELQAMALSPHDPLLCAIQGSYAMALLRLGRMEEAAKMGLLASRQHNVHKHILGITAIALAAAGREEEARDQMARIRRLDGNYDLARFRGAFMQVSEDFASVARSVAPRIGLA